MKMSSCPNFSWTSITRAQQRPRQIPEHEPHLIRRDSNHTPCALRHKVAPVAYGDYDLFTRESNSSGI